MKIIELKYPIKIDDREEIKYLRPSRLKVKHIELLPESIIDKVQKEKDGGAKLDLTNLKELMPMFKDLKPFLASIFNVDIDIIDEIDIDADLELVFEGLEEAFKEFDEKK
jgi:hypothetical protein